jgi:MbtH protein
VAETALLTQGRREYEMFDDDDARFYAVVRNDEHQYSLWPADREPPRGWVVSGPVGSRSDCLDYIRSEWTDMRPKSLRDRMGA